MRLGGGFPGVEVREPLTEFFWVLVERSVTAAVHIAALIEPRTAKAR